MLHNFPELHEILQDHRQELGRKDREEKKETCLLLSVEVQILT
jgi:hypothetical protein